jgi:hypothetical protein
MIIPVALLGQAVTTGSLAATVTSAPYGVMAADVPNGNTGLSYPLIAEDAFVGRAAGNSAGAITFEGAGNIGSKLKANDVYYAEVLSGPLEGERFDLNTGATIAAGNSTVTLDLSAASHSTLKTLGADVLAQARVAIRPHLTLAKLAASFSPGLVGNNSVGQADLVKLVGPRGLTIYQLRGDNVTWREVGKTADVRNMVIPPDVGVLVQLRSGQKRWVHGGVVRTNAFRKNLVNGMQGFATGYPVDMTPAQIAAFVDASQPAGSRWVGSDNPDNADTIKIFDTALNDFRTYYLRADGATWTLVGDAANVANSPILKAPSLIAVSRKNSDADFVVIPPFTL